MHILDNIPQQIFLVDVECRTSTWFAVSRQLCAAVGTLFCRCVSRLRHSPYSKSLLAARMLIFITRQPSGAAHSTTSTLSSVWNELFAHKSINEPLP